LKAAATAAILCYSIKYKCINTQLVKLIYHSRLLLCEQDSIIGLLPLHSTDIRVRSDTSALRVSPL
jgi:hypothetical protein